MIKFECDRCKKLENDENEITVDFNGNFIFEGHLCGDCRIELDIFLKGTKFPENFQEGA